ncbi:sucrose transporter [Colletotrichum zoysiae]|uniref:Sucrose transporter n=1 Tax=Colletotrichum zoysiae TaxID=1216348 RepID=A0AAD9M5Z5_9PEZI|nr:sucrose transporter [Colletotrichum zoysiae]
MNLFGTWHSTTDVPLHEVDKTLSSTKSDSEPVLPAENLLGLPEKHSCISMWCIVAYATPIMSSFFFMMFTVYLVPYLTANLGFTGFQVSLVLTAGPLSGLTVSPVFGILSDRSGRRYIYFVIGSAAMAACQLVLGWSRQLVGDNLVAARWLSAAAIFTGCMSARACIVGIRLLAMDNVPPGQQPIMSLMSGLTSSMGSICILAAGLLNSSFQLITLICAIGISLSIFPVWLARPTEYRNLVLQKQRGGFSASFLSVPRDIWTGRTSLPPMIRHVATRGNTSEPAPPDLMMKTVLRVMLIAHIGGIILQMTIATLWSPSLAPGAIRRLVNEDMAALRRIWALAMLTLAISTLASMLMRSSFITASLCITSILYIAPLNGFVPPAMISYEAAVFQTEKGSGLFQSSAGMFFSYVEIAITTGQGLSAVGNAIINFVIERIETPIKNPTALLFPPTIISALVAVLIC